MAGQTRGQVAARERLEAALAHNSAGRPARASAAFRAALRRLGPADPDAVTPAGAASVAEDAYLRSRCLLGLALSEFELRADVVAAEAGLDGAEEWARVAGARALAVAIQGQRGLVRLRGGDVHGALHALDGAVARLADAEPVDACRILLNRSSLLLELGRLEQARADLRACVGRAERLGDRLRLVKARHNLGYLEFLAGDLPAALDAMAQAAATEHGASPAIALLDRARVLVEAGLVTEADQILAEAARALADQRLVQDLAEAELARAQCALLARRPAAALRWARSARRRFLRRGNAPWTRRAELVVCQAELATLLAPVDGAESTGGAADGAVPAGRTGGGDRSARSRSARRTALGRVARRAEALLEPSSTRDPGVDPWFERAVHVTAAEALAAADRVDDARAALGRAGRLTGREPVALAVQHRLVRAQLALAVADRGGARRHVHAGQAVLAEHRRRLGSVETVAAAAVHGARLVELDVGAALGTGRPEAVLDAVERGRATFAGPTRVRPPQDPLLAETLAELRQCLERRRALPPDGGAAAAAEREALRRAATRLQQQARERSWRVGEGTAAPPATTAADLMAAVQERGDGLVVVDLVVHAGTVHGVVVDGARPRLVRLARTRELTPVLRRVRTDLEVLARSLPPGLAEVARRSLRRGLERLDDLLLAPLACSGPLHVVAGGSLVTVPWGALPSRRGLETTVSTRAATGPRTAGPDGGVSLLAGPGLAHAEDEVAAVAQRWPDARPLVGQGAVCAAARRALAGSRVVHLAAHGHHEADNPLFSWVRLADGPLFAHELESLRLPGSVVVLSACEVGRATERPGGEVLGLASVLLRLGATVVVAGLAPLRDDLVARVMPDLHEHLSAGANPADALARACSGVGEPVAVTAFASTVG